MKLNPLGDRIIVKPKEEDTATTASGLVIPDTAKDKPQLRDVLAVGPGAFHDGERLPMDVKEGDVLVYSKYSGTKIKFEGGQSLILPSRDVPAVLR